MMWDLWGSLVTFVGLFWIYKGEIEISIEGKERFYRISGVAARLTGALISAIGIRLLLFS